MSYLTVALNDVLDRMKTTAGTTRETFARNINMPLSTLTSYAHGRPPNPKALEAIIEGLHDEEDRVRIIRAHIDDTIPDEWRERVQISEAQTSKTPRIPPLCDIFSGAPQKFRRNVELVLMESRRNPHVSKFFEELVYLLGLEGAQLPSDLCPPLRTQPEPPASTVHGKGGAFTGDSTHALNEDTPAARSDAPETPGAKPKLTRTRAIMRAVAQKKSERKSE